ncbi:MAG: shikimate dehydrogenase [Pseudomonadota bacterium]
MNADFQNLTPFSYAVIGDPISHSLSPHIHKSFAKQFEMDLDYRAIQVAPEKLDEFFEVFIQEGGKGCNVTLPLKEKVFEKISRVTDQARIAGAANTVTVIADELSADNTDGVGLMRDLERQFEMDWRQMRILILGAGGAARGILYPLLQKSPKAVILINRSMERAKHVQQAFASYGSIEVQPANYVFQQPVDLIIHATSAAARGESADCDTLFNSAQSAIRSTTRAYDLMYQLHDDTHFCKWAKANHIKHSVDGLGMLVEQAAESFTLWHGQRPEVNTVLENLRKNHT